MNVGPKSGPLVITAQVPDSSKTGLSVVSVIFGVCHRVVIDDVVAIRARPSLLLRGDLDSVQRIAQKREVDNDPIFLIPPSLYRSDHRRKR